jgi:hypothetical protein
MRNPHPARLFHSRHFASPRQIHADDKGLERSLFLRVLEVVIPFEINHGATHSARQESQ